MRFQTKEIVFFARHKRLDVVELVLMIDMVNRCVFVLPESELEGGNQIEWSFDEIELSMDIPL